MFSQNKEEQVILDYFDGKIGKFLDIGAYDGKTFSNTHQLALDGWSGVCVEPSAGPFKALTDLYRDNDKIELVNCAMIDDYADPRFMIAFHDSGGDAISSCNELHVQKWGSEKFRKTWVMPITLFQVERMFGNRYDFINIDVEGKNVDLLEGFKDMLESVSLICIEHDSEFARIDKIREVYGLEEIHRNGENVIFGRKKAEPDNPETTE
jgi:FkbM family methyltransferase